jgi:hypothetical protein
MATDRPSVEKAEIAQKEILHDHELQNASKEEAIHLAVLTEEEKATEKLLLRKIDALIMPLVVLVYLLNYIDRNNYAATRLQGLERDLGLDDSEYQTGLSILFVGYVSNVNGEVWLSVLNIHRS